MKTNHNCFDFFQRLEICQMQLKKTIKGVIDKYLIGRDNNGSFASQFIDKLPLSKHMSNCTHSVSRTRVTLSWAISEINLKLNE